MHHDLTEVFFGARKRANRLYRLSKRGLVWLALDFTTCPHNHASAGGGRGAVLCCPPGSDPWASARHEGAAAFHISRSEPFRIGTGFPLEAHEPSISRKYPAIAQSWRRAWSEVIPFYAFPDEVRRIVYTTNAIEALNAKLRRAVRARGHFPTDEAAMKLLFLVLNRSEKDWRMPPREWAMAKAQFAILFDQRFTRAQT